MRSFVIQGHSEELALPWLQLLSLKVYYGLHSQRRYLIAHLFGFFEERFKLRKLSPFINLLQAIPWTTGNKVAWLL